MAKFLFTVWPFAGHLHPSLAVAHALRARGHDVAFYTGGTVRPVVEHEGFKFFPFHNVDEERVCAIAHSEFCSSPSFWKRLQRARQLQDKFREWLLDTVPRQVEDLEAVLSEWRADVLVCDLAFWSPILVFHEKGQIPVAVFSILAACVLPGPDAPIQGRGLPRPRNAFMRWSSRVERSVVASFSTGFRAHVNRLRRSYGLPPLRISVTEFAGQMPLYLVPSTPEFDYERHDLPRSVQYVGPCLWDKPSDKARPEWVAQLADDRPLVYVTEATIGVHEPFLLRTAMRALSGLPMQVVMTTGKHREGVDLDLGPPVSNIRVESYVPQSDLLPKASVMVTLGGSGGVLAALKMGVPLVIVPTEWDRPENAQRVVEAGAGLRIAPNRCTPERLRAAVEQVMTEPSFRQNAQRLAAAFAGYGGPDRAAELLEALSTPSKRELKLAHSRLAA